MTEANLHSPDSLSSVEAKPAEIWAREVEEGGMEESCPGQLWQSWKARPGLENIY